ncbi:MAG: 4Fe-4S dicluster domain-containing protein [Deltaproteobacteria bacterium]|nr:4Fe-4S dicluster domain-containing protein [Deltaproteobacteria bacterium]
MNQLIYLKGVVTLKLDENKCAGCGMCLQVCPRAVLSMANGTAEIVNRDGCMECGACSRNCPVEAISVESGVGCAAAVINSKIGRKKESCCYVEPSKGKTNPPVCSSDSKRSSCC